MNKHTVTSEDLPTRNGDTYYTGPLEPAKAFVHRYEQVSESVEDGTHVVLIGTTHAPGDKVTWETADEWGKGPDNETAWRYAIGALFGPEASEFVPFEL